VASTPGQIRPWRNLASFVGIVAFLYALVFATGDHRALPKLGIDLQGGTRVTLEARTADGSEPPRDQLLQAQEIIEQRVNGLGVSGAEVVLDGTNLVITVPGEEGEQARSLGQTAQLRFREVVDGPFPVGPAAPPDGAVVPGQSPADSATSPAPTSSGAPTSSSAPSSRSGTPTSPGSSSSRSSAPTSTPQGAGVALPVHPVAYSRPSPSPGPPPPPAPPAEPTAPNAAPADPRLAAKIERAARIRQNPALVADAGVGEAVTDAARKAALEDLNCADDPLRGYDDPQRPLVACDQDGTVKYILSPVIRDKQNRALEGTLIANARAGQNSQGVGFVVELTFRSEGQEIWGEYTSANVGKLTAFVLDGEVVSAPQIREPILGGTTQVSGNFTQTEAQALAGVLRYGSLPLSFASSEAQTVSATLGIASLKAGLLAGGIGLLLVFVYCLFYYRILGILTILSLVLSGAIVYSVLVLLGRWIGFTLDLAGVAGFIVAIGITADSFVIFFERLKDEVREGRSFRSAVPRGWVRARRTILSADAVSFLASAVLYVLAVGQVKGFAFTLGLATVLDLVVVFLVTHPLVALAARSKVFGSPAWSGLGSVARIGAEQRRARAAAGAGKGV